jgi:hypothetical protein
VGKSRAYIVLKYFSLVFAVAGILLLRQLAIGVGTTALKINEIERGNNFARVEICGVIADAPTFFLEEGTKESGTIYFTIDDGTGTITVRCYPSVTRELLRDKIIPAFGDRVKVKAQVAFAGETCSLILQSPRDLHLQRTPYVEVPVLEPAAIARAGKGAYVEGTRVKVNGTLVEWISYKWAVSLWLRDDEGNRVNIWIPVSILELTGWGVVGRLRKGMQLEVVGGLKWYEAGRYSRWEIIPATSEEIMELGGE